MGSPFASLSVSDPIPLPFDPSNTVTVRKLSARELESAAESHMRGVASGSLRQWPERFKRLVEKGEAPAKEVAAALRDPLTGFDRFTVVRIGLVSWSYPQSLTPIAAVAAKDGQPAIEAYDPIEDLDDDALEFIATEIMRRTKPHLFLTAEEQETARKND